MSKRKISIAWRLILISWSLALAAALALTFTDHARTRRQLLSQLESTLETKCDEVITVLGSGAPHRMLQEFLAIETDYRFSPFAFYYQISDAQGQVLSRSDNLGDASLTVPTVWRTGAKGIHVNATTRPNPTSPQHRRIRLRSERVAIASPGGQPAVHVIQTGVSLEPLEVATRAYLFRTLFNMSWGLAGIFLLLVFVTKRALRPVSVMTKMASRITASNLRERLPISGTEDELDALAEVLNYMLDRLERSLQQMEQFSSDAAHQLRTPLTRMRGELDLILRDGVSDAVRGRLQGIEEELDHLSRVCRRLLLLARLDQSVGDESVFDDGPIELGAIVSELLEQLSPMAHERGVRLRQGRSDRVSIRGSRTLLVEALLNLLHNAIRFTPGGGSVAVSVRRMNGSARISVEDTGPGIPLAERERVFRRFYKMPDSPGGSDQGPGLGLAIVKGIAEVHGGRVELDSAAGGGCTFRLILPIGSANPRHAPAEPGR